jgi:hypothetical protein
MPGTKQGASKSLWHEQLKLRSALYKDAKERAQEPTTKKRLTKKTTVALPTKKEIDAAIRKELAETHKMVKGVTKKLEEQHNKAKKQIKDAKDEAHEKAAVKERKAQKKANDMGEDATARALKKLGAKAKAKPAATKRRAFARLRRPEETEFGRLS